MFKKLFCFLALAATFSVPACAGVMGHSILSLTDIQVVDVSNGNILTASFFGAPAQLTASNSTTSATNVASLDGFAPVTTTGGSLINTTPLIVAPPVQAADAVSGNLAGDYLRSQSFFDGSFVALEDPALATVGSPADSLTQADFNVDTLGLTGSASSNVTNTSIFRFTAQSSLTARLEFHAIVDMLLADAIAPPGFYSNARTSFSVTLSESGVQVPGFGGADAETDLNNFISIPPSNSPAVVFIEDDYQSLDFDLTAGSNYTLTLNQTVSVRVGVVPEPSSFLAFASFGLTGFVRRRRR